MNLIRATNRLHLARSRFHPIFALAAITLLASCTATSLMPDSHGWLADYESAERQVRASEGDMLLFYRDPKRPGDSEMAEALRAEAVATCTDHCTRCMLFRAYEPDRRYVAQFGIKRTPAIVVVHADGTYHASTGSLSADEIVAFMEGAKAPGKTPAINMHIPREARYDWMDSIEEAERIASAGGQDMFVVFHRPLSRDWSRINKMLATHEVYRRLASLVPTRVVVPTLKNDAFESPYGSLQLPAIVIVRVDGTHKAIEQPTSPGDIARFADAALRRQTVRNIATKESGSDSGDALLAP